MAEQNSGTSLFANGVFDIVQGLNNSRDARKEKRRGRREIEKAKGVIREELNMAQEQFDLFKPFMGNFINFFTDNSLEDIVSGRVASKTLEPINRAIKTATDNRLSRLKRGLNQRGLGDTELALIGEQEILRDADFQRSAALSSDIQNQINDRFRFSQLAERAGNKVTNARGVLAQLHAAQGGLTFRTGQENLAEGRNQLADGVAGVTEGAGSTFKDAKKLLSLSG